LSIGEGAEPSLRTVRVGKAAVDQGKRAGLFRPGVLWPGEAADHAGGESATRHHRRAVGGGVGVWGERPCICHGGRLPWDRPSRYPGFSGGAYRVARRYGSGMRRTATHDLERAATASATVDRLMDVLPTQLQRLVGCGPTFVATVDPMTLHFVRAVRQDIGDEAAARFLTNEMQAGDVVTFRSLAAAAEPVDTLFRATAGAPRRSARWREVIEPLGWGDELRVALRRSGRTWGVVCLHRDATEPPFDEQDLTAVHRIVPVLAAAFQRLAISGAASTGATALAPGVIVLNDQFTVTSTTGAAADWLELLGSDGGGLPIALMSASARAVTSGHPQSVVVVARDGRWASIHAAPLHGPGPEAVAVVVQPAHPSDTFPAFAAAAGLTPRETEVAAAVLRGLSDRAIARRLELSEYTVQDHLKRVYAKTGANGRADLVGRLLLG
jgi:DNA-binding CsgD family transcriptional regulator